MPGIMRRHIPAYQPTELYEDRPLDFDPEEEFIYSKDTTETDVSGSPTSVNNGGDDGREHYEPVLMSSLRKRKADVLESGYTGTRIDRRHAAEDEDHYRLHSDRNGFHWSNETDLPEERFVDIEPNPTGQGKQVFGDRNAASISDRSSENDSPGVESSELEEEVHGTSRRQVDPSVDREELRRVIDHERKSIVASLSAATEADVTKGRAVKEQMSVYDSLLNARIQIQQALIATNSIQAFRSASVPQDADSATSSEAIVDRTACKVAEEAALTLWNNLHGLRLALLAAPLPFPHEKTVHETVTTSLGTLWSQSTDVEELAKSKRHSVLSTWSQKMASLITQTSAGTQRFVTTTANSRQATIPDILKTQHLSSMNIARLIVKTRIPRSCAPLQVSYGIAESDAIFDDTDFYGQLLKELLEKRNVDTSSAVFMDDGLAANNFATAERAYRAVQKKHKPNNAFGSKTSKGRKMRYSVHERLQNFMAAESRGIWGPRQVDELFGSLLGRRLSLEIAAEEDRSLADDTEDALRLFRA